MSGGSSEAVLWDILRGSIAVRALAVGSDLRVAHALGDGARAVEDVENTRASQLLRAPGWDDFAHLFGTVWHRAAGELDATSSQPVFPRLFHTDFRSWLAAHPSERAAFDRAMARGTAQRVEQLAALDWRGNGSLLRGLLGRHEGLRAIVLDLPETVREEEDFDGRCSFVAGSFFVSVPPGDTYVLSTILHDWNDESAARILRAIRSSASAGARLLALDAVIPEGNEPHGAKWLDLLMLSLFAGRERDEAQWRAVLEANGFSEPVAVSDGLVEARCR